MTKVLITGSFDPVTVGHFSLVQKAAAIFDEVTLCLFVNPDKMYRFTLDERLEMLRCGACELGLSNVTVDASQGYVADYAAQKGIPFVLRGIRNGEDARYELDMARYNHTRNPALETLFWAADDQLAGISSTAVRKSLEKGVIPEDALLSSTVSLIQKYQKNGK